MAIEMEQDEKNREIMDYIYNHPNATVAEIGVEVGLKREATQKRIARLYSSGKLKRQLAVDLDALGYTNRFRIDVNVSPADLREEQNEEIKKIKHNSDIKNDQIALALQIMGLSTKDLIVEDVSVLLGDPADLSVTVRSTQDLKYIFDFVTAKLRPLKGVVKTATCVESWAVFRDPEAIKYLDKVAKQNRNEERPDSRSKRG
jgi:DNA-binding Lrp family transcriptional regulator